MPKRYRSYTAEFKLRVVEIAESIGNRAAGREYQLDEKCVRRWRKDKEELKKMPKQKRARRFCAPAWPTLEENLKSWITVQREAGYSVSTVKIRMKAKIMAQEMNLTNFKGGSNWCYRFMRRNDLRVRTRTTVGQRLPADWEEKMVSFRTFSKEVIARKTFQPSQIINMDEVPLSFDCPPTRTVDELGARTVSITTTGNEKTAFTVVLACAADGSKLKPMLIFKRKTIPKEEFTKEVIIKCNEKGWMREEVMCQWLEEVWRRRKGSFFKPDGLLLMDSMRAHLHESVKTASKKVAAELAVIPGGLTKVLQPLDIAVNKSFKSEVRKRWEQWMIDGIHSYTKTGRMRKATFSEVAKWVAESWNAVKISTVIAGFRKSGIMQSSEEDSEDESDDDNEAELDNNFLELFNSDSDDSDFEGFE